MRRARKVFTRECMHYVVYIIYYFHFLIKFAGIESLIYLVPCYYLKYLRIFRYTLNI